MMLATGVACAVALLGAFGQHPGSLVRKAQENGGRITQSLDLSVPIHTVHQLVAVSGLVVQGRVQSVAMRLSSDERLVITAYEVMVQRIFKGPAVSTTPGRVVQGNVEVIVPGGTVSVDGLHISTVADEYPPSEGLVAGEEVLLFLIDSNSEAGKFVLAAGPYSAFRLSGGVAHAMTRAAAKRRGDRPMPVAAFLTEVSTLVRNNPDQ